MRILFISLILLARLAALGQQKKPEIPLSLKGQGNTCRADSLDCTIWLGLAMPLRIMDSVLSNPYFSSNDVEVIYEKGMYYPAAIYEQNNMAVGVDLYNISGADSVKVRTFYFKVKTVPDPKFSVAGQAVLDSISKSAMLRAGKLEVALHCALDSFITWRLNSFDMEIDGKEFSSLGNKFSPAMRHAIINTKSGRVRIMNERVVMLNDEGGPRLISQANTFILTN